VPAGSLTDEELEREVQRMRRERRRPSPHLLWLVPLLFLGYAAVRYVHRSPSLDDSALAVADRYVRDIYVRRDCAATRDDVAAGTVEASCAEQRQHWQAGLQLVADSRFVVRDCGLRGVVGTLPSTPARECVGYLLVRHAPAGGYVWLPLDLVLGRRDGRWRVYAWGSPRVERCGERETDCRGRRLWARRVEPTVPA
jgi:hypothetical protein